MFSLKSKALIFSLHFGTNLPKEIREEIFNRWKHNERKERSRENYNKFGRGTSTFAAKRRAKQVGKCLGCGALIHNGECRLMPSTSQIECAIALRQDPVKLKAERSLRRNSNASNMVKRLCDLRRSKLKYRPP